MAASERISQLPAAGALLPGSDLIPIVNNGTTSTITPGALFSTMIPNAGTLTDASQLVNGATWTALSAPNTDLKAILIQNLDPAQDVYLMLGATDPDNYVAPLTPPAPGAIPQGAILLEPRKTFPPPGFPFSPQNGVWARAAAAAAVNVSITVKVYAP